MCFGQPISSRLDLTKMRFAPLNSAEKMLLAAALVAACLVGAFAGYAAYLGEAEAQFHGGALEEDRAAAEWSLIWEPTWAFVRWGIGTAFIVGIAPIAARRFICGRSA